MKKFALVSLAILGLAVLVSFADASNCVVRQRVVHQAAVVHHAAAVHHVQQAVIAVYQAIPVYVQPHTVGYADSAQNELQRLKLEVDLRKTEVELQKHRNEFELLKQQQFKMQPQPIQQPPEKLNAPAPPPQKLSSTEIHPGIAVLAKNCASCHNSDTFKAKGGGFQMFDGTNLAKLTDRDALNIAREIFASRMPKGTKGLSDGDVGLVMSWLDSIK